MMEPFNFIIDIWQGPKHNSESWDVLIGKGEYGQKHSFEDVLQNRYS